MDAAFSSSQRREIAGRARTVFERLDGATGEPADDPDTAAVDELFDDWQSAVGAERALRERLARDDLTAVSCREAMRRPRWPDDEPLPDWLDRLERLVADVEGRDPPSVDDDPTGDDRPFRHFLAAIADHARGRLPATAHDALSPAAIDSLAEWLERRLSTAFTRLLYVEFKTFVAERDRDLAYADPEDVDDPPTEYYQRFVGRLFDGEFAGLCVEYPVFARLLVTRVRQWVELVAELARRADADRDALRAQFGSGEPLGDVTDVEPLAEDTHGDGRAVLRVDFAVGRSVVYKPRSVDPGAAFYDLLDRLDDRLPVSFATPAFVARDGYGWMEWVEHRDCADEDAVRRYYRRAGSLICVAYLLGLTDCHYENLLADGEHPVLVDLETVLAPDVDPARRPQDADLRGFVDDSVLLTGLVPWQAAEGRPNRSGRRAAERSGLGTGSSSVELTEHEFPDVTAANTDVMAVEYVHPTIDAASNTPSVNGEPRPPGRYADEILDGFRRSYGALADLARADGAFAEVRSAFESVEHRFIYRATHRYGRTVSSMLSRSCLQDGARLTVEMEQLLRPFFDGSIPDRRLWDVYEFEREAMKRLDPPRLTLRTDGTTLHGDGRALGADVSASGLRACQERLDDMGDRDLERQTELLRHCFGRADDGRAESGPPTTEDPIPPTDARLRDEAVALFNLVRGAGHDAGRAGTGWTSVVPGTGRGVSLRSADESLYFGRPGIALAAAALYRCVGDDAYRSFAVETLDPVVDRVRSDADPAEWGPGGAVGVGSVAYSLAVAGELLDSEELLSDARTVADAVAGPVVDDPEHDVVGGTAGTILGLLGVADRTAADGLVTAAARCGDRLLDARVATQPGPLAWPSDLGTRPLTGFAHGAGGVGYALARLGSVADEPRFLDAAREAFAYERATFSAARRNWPDFRRTTDRRFADGWCHGRSGVGLSRVGALDRTPVNADAVAEDAAVAFDATVEAGVGAFDHPCCGNFGRTEFLLEASRVLGREPDPAVELAGEVLARKDEVGEFAAMCHSRTLVNSTFFWGLSGVVYSLLRLAVPDDLPCVLLWE